MRHHSPCRRFPNRCASRGIKSGGRMIPAREACTPRDAARLLVLDPEGGAFEDTLMPELPRFLRPGDLLVVNDAATLPASLQARTASGVEAEIRLLGQIEDSTWKAALFGPGDWRTPTELRDPPERVTPGSVLSVGESLAMEVVEVSPDSPRLITVRFDRSGEDLWTALYACGKPIQYSYLSKDLALWSVQTVYAARPWAVEMPSDAPHTRFAQTTERDPSTDTNKIGRAHV